MEEQERQTRARELFEEAFRLQMSSKLNEAIRTYKQAIALHPTAEAYTFLGWTFSFMGLYDLAIEHCHRAIELDPDFGNPYNDIGSYLIAQRKYDEAIPWLRRAMKAKRYECPHYPHFNLGRVWMKKGMIQEAMAEFREALALHPDYTLAHRALKKLEALLN